MVHDGSAYEHGDGPQCQVCNHQCREILDAETPHTLWKCPNCGWSWTEWNHDAGDDAKLVTDGGTSGDKTSRDDPLVLTGSDRVKAESGVCGVEADLIFAEIVDVEEGEMSVGVGGSTDGVSLNVEYDTEDRRIGALASLTPEQARRVATSLYELAEYKEDS